MPRIVVICLDQFGVQTWEDCLVPQLRALASEGIRIARAVVGAPVCAPSRGSFLTGLFPVEHGQLNNNSVLPGQWTLIAAIQELGFHTASFGKLHTNNTVELAGAGFGYDLIVTNAQETWAARKAARRVPGQPKTAWTEEDRLQALQIEALTNTAFGGPECEPQQHDDWIMAQEALDYFRAQVEAGQDDLWLNVSLLAPHQGYRIPRPWHDTVLEDDMLLAPVLAKPERAAGIAYQIANRSFDDLTPEHHLWLRSRYRSYVAWIDFVVGQLVADLRAADPDVLIAIHSDHGQHDGHRGAYLKETGLPEAAMVPVILVGPQLPENVHGTVYSHPFSLLDLYPTIAGLAGLDTSVFFDGSRTHAAQDWSEELLADAPARTAVFTMLSPVPGTTDARLFGVYTARCAGIYYRGSTYIPTYQAVAGLGEVYDLAADPNMENNLVGTQAAEAFTAELGAARAELLASLVPKA